MAISNETRKRLWARSGNRCALCRNELVRSDTAGLPGALVGEEAHIVARSTGGARFEPLDVAVRDGYDNLILLCANDHKQVDDQPKRYTVEALRSIKHRHELWVKAMLDSTPPDNSGTTVVTPMRSGTEIWDLLIGAFAFQAAGPESLTDDEADLVDGALQVFVDWGEISETVIDQGFRAIRDAKRSIDGQLKELGEAGFVVLGGQREGRWAAGAVRGRIAVLQVARPQELDAEYERVPAPETRPS